MLTVFSTQYYLGTPPSIYSDNAQMTPKRRWTLATTVHATVIGRVLLMVLKENKSLYLDVERYLEQNAIWGHHQVYTLITHR